jgi:hypothetical protein
MPPINQEDHMYVGTRFAAVLGSMTILTSGVAAHSRWTPPVDAFVPAGPMVSLAIPVHNDQVHGAMIGEGFCIFVADYGLGFSGYSGSSQRVDTPSGRTNYHCKTDLLFGEPPTRAVHFRDVSFFDFFVGTFVSCDIDISAGGQAIVQCHE